MSSAGLPWALSQGVTVVAASLLVSACGVPLDQRATDNNVVELTLVLMDQYNTPVLLTVPSEPTLYRVSADITLVFRFAEQPTTLRVDIEDLQSERVTHNEFDLAVVAPGIVAMTDGRWDDLRVPLMIPELGALQFSATLINHDGTMSRATDGRFTVQAEFGANDTTQTETTQVGIVTELSAP